jgi:hypothetical protein
MRYGVDTEALRSSANSVQEALMRLEVLGLPDDLSRVATAFPGGRTASVSGQVCLAWQSRLSDTRGAMRSLGGQLSAAAWLYDAVESSARRALTSVQATQGPAGSR